jgi:hypothetical protein
VGPYPISVPRQPLKQWGQSQPSVNGWLLGLLGLYLWHAIGTFNTCSRGPTHWSLTDTGGDYILGGVGFPHTTPRPSQPMILHIPPKGPARSQVIQSEHKPQVKVMWNTYHRPVLFRPLGVYRSLYLRLAMANVIQIPARSSRVIQKVFIIQLRFQSTPTNLTHHHSWHKDIN